MSPSDDLQPELGAPTDPAVSFSRRTAFRFAAGAAGVAAVAATGTPTAAADRIDPATAGPECAADVMEEN